MRPPDGELKSLVSRFQEATATLQGVSYHIKGEEVSIVYRARNMRVHGTDMRGAMAQSTHDEIQPVDKGFVVTAYVFDHKRGEAPRSFQEARTRQDWDYADYQIAGADKAIYFNIRWGKKIDKEVLKHLYHAVETNAKRLPG